MISDDFRFPVASPLPLTLYQQAGAAKRSNCCRVSFLFAPRAERFNKVQHAVSQSKSISL